MLKLTMLVKRKKGISYQQFDEYWHGHHAPLVASLQQYINYIRYVQTVPHVYADLDQLMLKSRQALRCDFDGMAEIWWQSKESLLQNRHSPNAIAALQQLLEDEKKFVDHSQSIIWYANERVIIAE